MRVADTIFNEPTPVAADNFLQLLHANVDNKKLSDKKFREFVRNTLPIVEYPHPKENRVQTDVGGTNHHGEGAYENPIPHL